MAKQQVIYGIHAVQEALQANTAIDKVLIRKEAKNNARIQALTQLASAKRIPTQLVPEVKLSNLSGDANHQGVVAIVAQIAFTQLEDLLLSHEQLGLPSMLLMLDGVTDVRNFGAIVRTSECLGFQGIIVPSKGSAAINAEVAKVSSGALYHIPICRENMLVDAVLMLQSYGVQVVACTEKSNESIYELDFQRPTCLILGSEERGISAPLLKRADLLAGIPLRGKVSSLNVSVAAGIAMSEAVRQRSYTQF